MLRAGALEHKRRSVSGCSNGAKVERSKAQPGELFRDVTATGRQRLRNANRKKKNSYSVLLLLGISPADLIVVSRHASNNVYEAVGSRGSANAWAIQYTSSFVCMHVTCSKK
jgi:hypothetical protein